MNGLSHYHAATETLFGVEECSYKMKSRVWHQCMRFVVCIRSCWAVQLAGFGGTWNIDASDEENEKPYL